GMAENFLGTWLKARNPLPDAITVGSKWGYTYVGSWRLDASVHEVKDLSGDTLRRQIVESRALIGHRLQLYQIHSATLESKALKTEAVARRTTIDALALAAALSQPWVDVVLSGAVTVAHLDSNLNATAFEPEPTDLLDIAESPTDYWARRSGLAWQ